MKYGAERNTRGENVVISVDVPNYKEWYALENTQAWHGKRFEDHFTRFFVASTIATLVFPINPIASLTVATEAGRRLILAIRHSTKSDRLAKQADKLLESIEAPTFHSE